MKSLYISRVIITNFKNFKHIDVRLSHKQVIIGENNVGKTNFLKALQLILDPSLSDEDRYLDESDFFDGLENPMENNEKIEIKIYISNYTNNKNILAQLSDATVMDEGKECLLFTYRYYPVQLENGEKEYEYIIFKGTDESKIFTHEDRKYLNLKVIKALRDVESELKNTRISPINKLLKKYDIEKKQLEEIANNLKEKSADILSLDEIIDLENNINNRFAKILGIDPKLIVSFKTIEIDPSKILNSLKLLLGDRQINDTSLGLSNILYISLILLMLRENTIPSFLKKSKYEELKLKNEDLLNNCYQVSDKGNYILKNDLAENIIKQLYDFMNKNYPQSEGVTILAIEEPEAHLHPIFQRLIYKDVIRDNNNSVLLTTHSTHISSIAPLNSIVHMYKKSNGETEIKTTTTLDLGEKDTLDLERYIDVKRGEIYLGKGIILVEGIAEEYLVPRFAELLGKPLDEKGIVVCNINSTNFLPFVKYLEALGIPFIVITDGDFYYEEIDNEGNAKRIYHVKLDKTDKRKFGYLGNEIVSNILIETGKIKKEQIQVNITEQEKIFSQYGFFVGTYTFEVDIMESCFGNNEGMDILCNIFNELTTGGKKQKDNFKNELEKGDFWSCLNKIEQTQNNIGKGRFSQKLSNQCIKSHIPKYVSNAIEWICNKVEEK